MGCLKSQTKSYQLQPLRQKKKELEKFLEKTRIGVAFKYFESQKYFAAEKLQGKDKQ